jgi:protein-disulfide isomerase
MRTIIFLTLILFCVSGSALAQQAEKRTSPEWSLGKSKAPVLIEVFSDYQCRRCAAFNTDLKHVQLKYGDQVRMTFHEFPLTQIHNKALLAAQAAEAAGPQGRFFK